MYWIADLKVLTLKVQIKAVISIYTYAIVNFNIPRQYILNIYIKVSVYLG